MASVFITTGVFKIDNNLMDIDVDTIKQNLGTLQPQYEDILTSLSTVQEENILTMWATNNHLPVSALKR